MAMNADLNEAIDILDIHEPDRCRPTACDMLSGRKPPAMQSVSNKPIICLVGNITYSVRKPEAFLHSGP